MDNSRIDALNASWTFDNIADDFEAHVSKSVPFYAASHELVCSLSDYFLEDDSLIYELGCSTGLLSRQILARHPNRDALRLIGIDSVQSMVDKATALSANETRSSFICDDLTTCTLNACSLICSFYTLQFIHPHYRQDVVNKIYDSLNWGGAFIVFEKVRAPDARFQDITTQVYTDFKLSQGFDESEIINKARSLKGVLEPFSTQGNLDLFKRAGFVDILTVFKWSCFEGFLAIK